MSRPIHCLSTSQSDVFLLNSRPGLFTVTLRTPFEKKFIPWAPHLPKLRGHFAEFLKESSLERLTIFWLSTCVGLRYERLYDSRMGFSWQCRINIIPSSKNPVSIASDHIFLHGYRLTTETSNTPHVYLPASPPLLTCITGSGILTGCPSTTPFGLVLGSTNPGRINLPQETLDFRRYGFSP